VTTYPKVVSPAANTQPQLDWQAVLYHGHAKERVPLAEMREVTDSTPPRRKERQVT